MLTAISDHFPEWSKRWKHDGLGGLERRLSDGSVVCLRPLDDGGWAIRGNPRFFYNMANSLIEAIDHCVKVEKSLRDREIMQWEEPD